MEYGKAFTFLIEDTEWVTKLAIAALLVFASGIIPIVPLLLVMGYTLELTRNVAHGVALPLPRWELLEDKFKHGAMVFVIGVVYWLPMALLIGCMAASFIALSVGAGASASAARNGDSGAAGGILALMPLVFVCFGCLATLYGFVAGLMMHAATLIYLNTGALAAAFRVGEVWALVRRYLGDFVMLWLATLLAQLGVLLVGIVTCGLAYLVGAPWLMLMQAHLLGQVSRKAFPPAADALVPAA